MRGYLPRHGSHMDSHPYVRGRCRGDSPMKVIRIQIALGMAAGCVIVFLLWMASV